MLNVDEDVVVAVVGNLIDQIDSTAADYIRGGFDVKDGVLYNRFRFYQTAYPVWPRLPRDGLYSYDATGHHEEDLRSYDFLTHYNYLDPLYYTPQRVEQLRKEYVYKQETEKFSLQLMRAAPYFLRNQAYRDMKCEMSNISAFDGPIGDAILGSPIFNLPRGNTNTNEYKVRMMEFFNFTVCPQKTVVLELFAILKELGVYHFLDCEDLIAIYQMSMYHPNAVVCHGCRKINWIYHSNDDVEAEYMLCMTPICRFKAQKRDVPLKASMALPLHGFNLNHFLQKLF